MMKVRTYINILSLLGVSTILGAGEFTVIVSESCYRDSEDAQLIVHYTGTGSPTAVRWKFSKMINDAAPLNVVIDFCVASAGADAAFPEDKMTYECDTVNNQYTITISSFNETADAGIWEAAVSVDGSFTSFKNVTVDKCAPTTTARTPEYGLSAGAIAGIVVGPIPGVIACIVVLVFFKKHLGKQSKEKIKPEAHGGNTRSNQTRPSVTTQNEQNDHGSKKRQQLPPPHSGEASEPMHGSVQSLDSISKRQYRRKKKRRDRKLLRTNIPSGHNEGRALSANFDEINNPRATADKSAQRKGVLESLDEGTGGESKNVKKTKKKADENKKLEEDESRHLKPIWRTPPEEEETDGVVSKEDVQVQTLSLKGPGIPSGHNSKDFQ